MVVGNTVAVLFASFFIHLSQKKKLQKIKDRKLSIVFYIILLLSTALGLIYAFDIDFPSYARGLTNISKSIRGLE